MVSQHPPETIAALRQGDRVVYRGVSGTIRSVAHWLSPASLDVRLDNGKLVYDSEIHFERIVAMELSEKERTLVVEALREKAANLSGYSGHVGSRRGAKALANLESWVLRMRDLADRLEGKERPGSEI